jgi:signal transduction histidine kinase
VNIAAWLARLSARPPEPDWGHRKFVTRARTLFYARLAFLSIGLGILAIPRWSAAFGTEGRAAFVWYFVMIAYSVGNYLLIERGALGKAATFASLCLDLLVLVYMIAYSGGLKSPVLPTHLIYTIFFALLFPNPLAIIPPLLTLPIVAKIDTEIPGRVLELEDIFLLIWYSAINFIVVYVIVYLNEREDRQHYEIVKLQEHLRQMAVVEERNRLSREIHDGLGASLSSLILQAEYISNMAGDPDLKREIGELKGVAEESIDELRRSISMMKDDFEMVPSLEDYCVTYQQRTGLPVDLVVVGAIPRLESQVQLATFRVLQEALTNVRKHARASQVKVEIQHQDGKLRLMVQDDGKGFAFQGDLRHHYGLGNMRERARQLGGHVEIWSEPERGCRVTFEIPVGAGPAGPVAGGD